MLVEDGDLAATYSLIYSFLTERSHFKAAEAVKKAAKDMVIVKGHQDGPTLPAIVNQWKKFTTERGKETSPIKSTRSRGSGSDANSDSSEVLESSSGKSSGSDRDSDTGVKSLKTESDGESSSGSDTEFDGSRSIEVKRITPGESAKAKEVIVAASDSSDSGSESSESEEDTLTPLEAATVKVDVPSAPRVPDPRSRIGLSQTIPTTKSSNDCDNGSESSECSSSSDDSDSSSGSDSDSDNASRTGSKPVPGGNRAKVVNMTSTSAASTTDRPTAVTKRRRTDETGGSVIASVIRQPKASNPHPKENGKGGHRKIITPFSRIKAEEVRFADERLKDNTFESRKAATNDYGARANADLVATRGAGFRKEKNKKKRGSYRGGEITMESHSIKFTD